VFTVQGNAFYWGGNPTNYIFFNPVISNYSTNIAYNLGWNTDSSSTWQYKINHTNEFADTNMFRLY
jgi:hypothetical protein